MNVFRTLFTESPASLTAQLNAQLINVQKSKSVYFDSFLYRFVCSLGTSRLSAEHSRQRAVVRLVVRDGKGSRLPSEVDGLIKERLI